jgi:hypothetical protein
MFSINLFTPDDLFDKMDTVLFEIGLKSTDSKLMNLKGH